MSIIETQKSASEAHIIERDLCDTVSQVSDLIRVGPSVKVWGRGRSKSPLSFVMILLTISALSVSLLSACGSSSTRASSSPAEALYNEGLDALDDEDFLVATERFQTVKTKFVYTQFAALSELRLGDVQFKQGRYIEAVDLYRLFVQTRPNHIEIPYAYWKIANAYYKQRPSDFALLPPSYERDRGPTLEALRALSVYLERYPEHGHVKEAKKYKQECRESIAAYELYVARFYRDQEKWVAAQGRYEKLYHTFKDVKSLWREGARELITVYRKLGLSAQRKEIEQALKGAP